MLKKLSLLSVLVISACSMPQQMSDVELGEKAHKKNIYYVTNRVASVKDDLPYFDIGFHPINQYGQVYLTVPKQRDDIKLQRQTSSLNSHFNNDPAKNIVYHTKSDLERAQFLKALRQSGKKKFVFLHGFNENFKRSSRRLAQLHHDLAVDSDPILYSWPSMDNTKDYSEDVVILEQSSKQIYDFLEALLKQSKQRQVDVLAHSMGNRGAIKAVLELSKKRPNLIKKIDHLILAAPDVSVVKFKNEYGPKLAKLKIKTYVLFSKDDLALKASKLINDVARLGGEQNAADQVLGIDYVDISEGRVSVLGHQEYGNSPVVVGQIRQILRK